METAIYVLGFRKQNRDPFVTVLANTGREHPSNSQFISYSPFRNMAA